MPGAEAFRKAFYALAHMHESWEDKLTQLAVSARLGLSINAVVWAASYWKMYKALKSVIKSDVALHDQSIRLDINASDIYKRFVAGVGCFGVVWPMPFRVLRARLQFDRQHPNVNAADGEQYFTMRWHGDPPSHILLRVAKKGLHKFNSERRKDIKEAAKWDLSKRLKN